MAPVYDVIVIGGGAVGMSTAWQLSLSGRRVLVLDKGRLGGEASGAAAGMLGAQLEVDEPGPFYELCLQSRARYPEFAESLQETTGIDIQLVQNGILQVAAAEDEVPRLRERAEWQTAAGGRAEWWSPVDVAAAEPMLSDTFGGLYLPDDGNVSAPLLTRALATAVGRSCTVQEGAEVIRLSADAHQVAVVTATDVYHAGHAVVAAGAWAKPLLRQAGVESSIYPVKGQLLALRPKWGRQLTRTIVTEDVYLVPKRDGTVVVGATEEHGAGFNRDLTGDALAALLGAALKAAPGLQEAVFERGWVGLRPGTLHGQPWIGPLPGQERLLLAVGHFRNGILLSPITAEMLTAAIDGRVWPELWRSFLPVAARVDDP